MKYFPEYKDNNLAVIYLGVDKNRYFNCFTDESIISFINENTKYNILGLYITEDKLGRVNEVKWVNLICNKKSV